MYLSDTLNHRSNAKLSFQLMATPTIVLISPPQFVSLNPCTTPTDGWWEKVYSTDTKYIGTELKKWRIQLNLEGSSSILIATLKKERCKDKAKIRELSEVIHEQNFMLQHNDQYMFELENQLEAIVAPPSEPVIPRS
jgi:hypothetical protein